MCRKPVKGYSELVALLNEKEIATNDEIQAMQSLKRIGYFRLIHGTRANLLSFNEKVEPTTFKGIVEFYLFERELKHLLFKYLVIAERVIKNLIAHNFHLLNKGSNSHFSEGNFDDSNSFSSTRNIIGKLWNLVADPRGNELIIHYSEKHNEFPLWVLFNVSSFGLASKFYSICKKDVQIAIAKELNDMYFYEFNEKIRIQADNLGNCIGALVWYRNICAHDNLLFSFKPNIKRKTLQAVGSKHNSTTFKLYDLVLMLKLFLTRQEYSELTNGFQELISKYKNKITFETQKLDELVGGLG